MNSLSEMSDDANHKPTIGSDWTLADVDQIVAVLNGPPVNVVMLPPFCSEPRVVVDDSAARWPSCRSLPANDVSPNAPDDGWPGSALTLGKERSVSDW